MKVQENIENYEIPDGFHLTADMRSPVKRRPVAQSALPVFVPDLLHLLGYSPPCSQRPPVNFELFKLAGCTLKLALGFLLIVAAPVNVIESQVPDGAPTIRDQDGRFKFRHSRNVLLRHKDKKLWYNFGTILKKNPI